MKHGGNVWQGGGPGEWLDYSANLRPEGTPEWVKRALADGVENARYYPDPSMNRASKAMAAYLGIDESFVRPTAGGISAIQMANRIASDETVILTPCFCEYEQFALSPVRKVSLVAEKHRIAVPDQLSLRKNSLVWLCNPMNPVGHAFERSEIVKLLEKVEAADSWLSVDEAFIEYCPEYTVADMVRDHERLIITGSMTKILGIPGVRIGYLCARPEVLEKLKAHQLTWELSCFAEAVACALPGHKADIREDSRRNNENRARFTEELEKLGIYVYPSRSACVLADFGRPVGEIEEKLKEQKILVRSCMSFDDINDGCHLRLAVKDESSNGRFIKALKEAIKCAGNH